jgi:hypothetical protein
VVLEPVEDVLALDAAVAGEVRRDLLDLRRVGRAQAAPVRLLQDHQLLRRRAPPRRPRRRLVLLLRRHVVVVDYLDLPTTRTACKLGFIYCAYVFDRSDQFVWL